MSKVFEYYNSTHNCTDSNRDNFVNSHNKTCKQRKLRRKQHRVTGNKVSCYTNKGVLLNNLPCLVDLNYNNHSKKKHKGMSCAVLW